MSTDRELLELAAKAAEIPLGYGDAQYFYCEHGPFGASMYGRRGNSPLHWNPLTDDGDALRLMAKLRLDVCRPYKQHAEVCVWVDHLRDFLEEPEGDDPAAATRRAIVRAAAEIGKAMP